MNFKDYFSSQSESYVGVRPGYPSQLFEFLADKVNEKNLAWDCATGNGQAAVSLSSYFEQIIATDASKKQIECARPKKNIAYKVATAECNGIESCSVDLITVATAIHWLDRDIFYNEAKRVLKPGGIIAIWGYGPTIEHEKVNVILNHLMLELLVDYWPKETRYSLNNYQGIDFPFEEIKSPGFECQAEWNFHEILSYINSWSATPIYFSKHKTNPAELIYEDLLKAWGNPDKKKIISWELFFKAGR